jgi:hypothetical protein
MYRALRRKIVRQHVPHIDLARSAAGFGGVDYGFDQLPLFVREIAGDGFRAVVSIVRSLCRKEATICSAVSTYANIIFRVASHRLSGTLSGKSGNESGR